MRKSLNRRELLIGGTTVAGAALLPSTARAAPVKPLVLVATQFKGLHLLLGHALSKRGFSVVTTFDPSVLPRMAAHLDLAFFDLANPEDGNARHVVEARRRGMRKPVLLAGTWPTELYNLIELDLGDQAILSLPVPGRDIMTAITATIEATRDRA